MSGTINIQLTKKNSPINIVIKGTSWNSIAGKPNFLNTAEADIETIKGSITTINSTIAGEITRAQSKETDIAEDLQVETNRATTAENALGVRITTETNRAYAAEQAIRTEFGGETTRAEAAEEALNELITTETGRAKYVEGNLATAIVDESNRAKSVEATKANSADVYDKDAIDEKFSELPTPEVGGAIALHNTNQSAHEDIRRELSDEATERTIAIQSTNTNLAAETTRATNKENVIAADLVTETNRALAAEQSTSTILDGEISRAKAKEDALTSQVALKADASVLKKVATTGAYSDLTGIPVTFSPSVHFHAISGVTGLAEALGTKEPANTNIQQHISSTGNPHGLTASLLGVYTSGEVDEQLRFKANKADLSTVATTGMLKDLAEDSTHRPTTDLEKAAWNAKSNFSGSYLDLTHIPTVFAPSAHTHAATDITGMAATLTTKADLVNGVIPANQLPSFVDDVVEYATRADFPTTGEDGKIYIALDVNFTYRWGGTTYVSLGGGGGVALGETASTAYRGDRGALAYTHSQETGNPHGTRAADISGLVDTLALFATNTDLTAHTSNTTNPHSVTATQVGLGNVVNTDTTTTANINDSTNKRFVSDDQITLLGNTTNTNSGDVTIGTGNGLTLVGQALSLGLASHTANGALSKTDWDTFNGKQATMSYGTGVLISNNVISIGQDVGTTASPVFAGLRVGSLSGILKASSGTLASAVSGTDYLPSIGGTTITTVGTIGSGTWNATAIAYNKGGTGLTTVNLGDMIFGSSSSTWGALAGNITSTKKFLTQTGTGSASGAPAWGTLLSADLPTATTSAQGAVTPDGTSILVNAGAISVATATASVKGISSPDGTTISITSGGILSAPGLMLINNLGSVSANITLPVNKRTTANLTAAITVTLPAAGTLVAGVENKVTFDFTSTVTTLPAISTTGTLCWSSANNNCKPNAVSTDVSVTNQLVFTTKDGGTLWTAEYKSYQQRSSNAVIYGYYIDTADSNPATRVHYIQDNANFANPSYMNFTSDAFSYGDWASAFFMPKPVMQKSNGAVDYVLSINDYTKRADGTTASDIANTSYAGNAMVQFPTIWTKRYTVGNYQYVLKSNVQVDASYTAFSWYNKNNVLNNYMYMGIYQPANISNVLRSISGQTIMVSAAGATEVSMATANGASYGWYTGVYSDWVEIQELLVLMAKSTDIQGKFGQGRSSGANSVTGEANSKGLFYGTSGNGMLKIFGMENYYGNYWKRIAGCCYTGSGFAIKMTQGTADGSTATDYNSVGTGYLYPGLTASGTSGGYISSATMTNYGLVPTVASGSSSTYFCDGLWWASGGYARVGGAYSDGALDGAFCLDVSDAFSVSYTDIGASLSCKPL